MTLSEAISVDFSQKAAASSIILPPNLSSHQADWTGIYLQYHDCPSHKTPEHYPNQHVVAIQTKGLVEAERKLGDRHRKEQIRVGDVCVVPAYTRHWISAKGEQGLILLGIEPDAISKILSKDLKIKQAKDYIHAYLTEKRSLIQ